VYHVVDCALRHFGFVLWRGHCIAILHLLELALAPLDLVAEWLHENVVIAAVARRIGFGVGSRRFDTGIIKVLRVCGVRDDG
jgi:hypothetical protein